MNDDTTGAYLEKELNIVMMAVLGGPNEKLRQAILAWGKMLMERSRRDALQRKEVLDLVEALEKCNNEFGGLVFKSTFSTDQITLRELCKLEEVLARYREAVK